MPPNIQPSRAALRESPRNASRSGTILFDLDGTLTDSGPGIMNCARHALSIVGHPGLDDATLRRFVGPPLQESFAVFAGLDEETAWSAVEAYRERYLPIGMYENEVYAGIVELLTPLLAAGRTMAVATSKAEPLAVGIIDHFGLAGFFTEVVGSNLDGTRTAKAQVVAEALRRLGGPDRDATVMIGDRSHDVVGARANGIGTVGVRWGYGSADELGRAGAQALVETPAELRTLLG
ncbi:MAG: HAD family hydrolase [Candidatus Nanopelagicales bacterium]